LLQSKQAKKLFFLRLAKIYRFSSLLIFVLCAPWKRETRKENNLRVSVPFDTYLLRWKAKRVSCERLGERQDGTKNLRHVTFVTDSYVCRRRLNVNRIKIPTS
jgi:hypothetical protein